MYCPNCGKEIDDKAIICIHCGCATPNSQIIASPQKSMALTIILWFFLGAFGAHRFYLGDNAGGGTMLALWLLGWFTIVIIVGVFPLLIVCIWWFIDLFLILNGDLKPKDGSKLS